MEKLLTKRTLCPNISKEDFQADLNCLFEILQTSYGAYDYFGHENFASAKAKVEQVLSSIPFDFHGTISSLNASLSFIKDGHFRIGEADSPALAPDHAVRYSRLLGIPVIDCKKFWYDTDSEREELEQFAASGAQYRDNTPLILDLRDNPGGSDVYMWDFFKGLFGTEPSFPYKYIQKYSPLFRASLRQNGFEEIACFEGDTEVSEEDGQIVSSRKPIYVLINENTASAAESAIAYFKTVESAVLVGTHSAGCFTCGNCITVYLPHSHLPVYVGTGIILYEGDRNVDAEGGFQADLSVHEWKKILCPHTAL